MFTLFKLDVEESIRGFAAFVDIAHTSITCKNFASLNKQGNSRFLAKLHTLSDDLMELQSLEVAWDQKP